MAAHKFDICRAKLAGYSFLVVLIGLMTACGKPLQVATQEQPSGAIQTSPETSGQGVQTGWHEISTDDLNVVNDFIDLDLLNHGPASDRLFAFDWSVSYGRALGMTASKLKRLLAEMCQTTKVLKENPTAYRDGEIPCGRILDANWKSMTQVSIPQVTVQKSKSKYTVYGFDFPVLMSRSQGAGLFSENSLDKKGVESRMSSRILMRDLSLQYIPQGNSALLRVCANLPGVSVTIPNRTIRATMKKKVLFGASISLTGSGNVQFGQYSYQYARGCADFNLSYDAKNMKPQIQLTAYNAPRVVQASYTGFKVRFNEWWLRLLDGVVDMFGPSLREMVQSVVNKKVNTFSQTQLENGEWMNQLIRDSVNEEFLRQSQQTVVGDVSTFAIPLGSAAIKKQFYRACMKVALYHHVPADVARFSNACEEFLNGIQIAVNPFVRDQKMDAKGCYNYMADIFKTHETNGAEKWWSNDCSFKVNVRIRVGEALVSKLPIFKEMLKIDLKQPEFDDEIKALLERAQLNIEDIRAMADQILDDVPQIRDPVALRDELIRRLQQEINQ